MPQITVRNEKSTGRTFQISSLYLRQRVSFFLSDVPAYGWLNREYKGLGGAARFHEENLKKASLFADKIEKNCKERVKSRRKN